MCATSENVIVFSGQGNFGKVFLSKAPGLLPDVGDDVLVMVKKLSPEQRYGNFCK